MKNVVRRMMRLCFLLACINLLVLKTSAITVKWNGGTSDPSCCMNSSLACKYLSNAFSCISNRLVRSHSNILIDGIAGVMGKIELIVPKDYNVTILSNSASQVVINCESSRSMLVVKSNGGGKVTFRNVIVQNCGPNVPSAILIEGPLNAEFDNCTFINNICSGINSRDANLKVTNSLFKSNIANQSNSFDIDFEFGNTSLGGGLGVMFHKGGGNKVEIISSNFILGSTFVNTDLNAVSHDLGKTKVLANYYAGGGGMAIINAFDSHNNSVVIRNCKFEQNRGTFGGGLFLTFVHNSSQSSILIENCTVAKNFASLTGGGFLISTWDKADNNTIVLKSCNIFSNKAMVGGAMKVIYNNFNSFHKNKGVSIDFQVRNCNVYDNIAISGSALRLLSNIPPGRIPPLLPQLHNCTISGHRPARNSKEYPGAILATKLGIEFYGENYLVNNTQGSAIYISSGTLHVRGILVFQHNSGLHGGAAYLADTSKLTLYPGSHLKISNNHANFRGGGLFVESTTLREVTYPYNPGCFLQYSEAKTPPSKWETKIEFTNNSASLKGAAIYLNSLIGCLWGEDDSDKQLNRTLRWADKITYSGNFILLDGVKTEGSKVDIATDTYDYIVKNSQKLLQIAPGETFRLNISAIDQLGNEVYSVPVVKQIIKYPSNKETSFGQEYFVLAPGKETSPKVSIVLSGVDVYDSIAGVNNSEFIRISATQSNFLVEKNLKLEMQRCYPGFLFDGNTCVCDLRIFGIERCSKGRYLYLKEGYWGGMVNGKFVTQICPRGYCKCSRKEGATGCFYDFKKPDDFCIPGRVGTLCGRCKDGLALSLRPTECINCDGTGWFLAVSMVCVLIFTILIIFFNPNIPTDLRGILFYVQVLPFLFKPNDRVGDIVSMISGICDLGRPTEYPFATCAMPGLGNLGTTTLNYVTPAEVLIILFVVFLIRRSLHFKRSKPFQCFLVLIILLYKYLVETSFAIIHCVDVGGKKVYFYDASWECYQGIHLAFFIVSLCVITFLVVLPIILLVIIVHRGAGKRYFCFRIQGPVIDAIAQGLRRHTEERLCENCENIRERFSSSTDDENTELEPCSPCTETLKHPCEACTQRAKRFWSNYFGNERGWWWSVDFARRVILVALYVFIQDWQLKQICITVACSCIFALHCIAWPYDNKKQKANEIEAVYLFALVILANVQSIEGSNTRHTISTVILLLTYGFAAVFFTIKATRFFRKFYHKRRNESASKMEIE